MSETISMTDILLTVSVGCNLWFLFLLRKYPFYYIFFRGIRKYMG